MEVLVVLLVSFVVLRVVGFLGVRRLAFWRDAGLGALVIMFLFTSTAHFSGMKHDLAAMMPEPLFDGLWIIYLTGVFEIAGAIGLLIPRTRRLAGICLVLLLVAVFPANVNAALNGIPLGGEPPTPLWLRAPMQLLFIGMVWWTSVNARRAGQDGPRHEVAARQAERETHGSGEPHAATARESDRIERVGQK
jgi:uncharacterized membrane protein